MGTFTYDIILFYFYKKCAMFKREKAFIVFPYLQLNLNIKILHFLAKFYIYSSSLLLTLNYVN